MKALWKGSLLIGALEIPIKIYTAVESQSLGFNLLHAKCKSPLNYQRYCPKCKKVIEWQDVVKGMKLADGSFFTITKENIEKLKPEKTDDITLEQFVPYGAIQEIYFDTHYYLAPTQVTNKSYFLLAELLDQLDKIAIGKLVMREKEYIVAIQPYEHGLLMSTLNYEYEIRPMDRIPELSVAVQAKVSAKERKLAEQLIKKMSSNTFDMSKFKDTFAEQLRERIKKAAAGKKVVATRAKKAVKVRQESLEKVLEASLKKVKKPSAQRTGVRAKGKK